MHVLFHIKDGEDKGSKNTKHQIIHFLWIRGGGRSCAGPPSWRCAAGKGPEQQARVVLGHQVLGKSRHLATRLKNRSRDGEKQQAGFVLGYQAGGVQQGEGIEQQAGVVLGHQAGVVQQGDGVEL